MDKLENLCHLRILKDELLLKESISEMDLMMFYVDNFHRHVQYQIHRLTMTDKTLTEEERKELEIILRAFNYTTANLLNNIRWEEYDEEGCENDCECSCSSHVKDKRVKIDFEISEESSSDIDFGNSDSEHEKSHESGKEM